MRNDTDDYINELSSFYARRELGFWEPKYKELIPSIGLSNAARHMANHQGPCGTYGDVYGNFLTSVLDKYYAAYYEDLSILKIEGEGIGSFSGTFVDDAKEIIEYILAQNHVDTSLLKSETNLHIGVGCACSVEKSYLCYIVTAKDVLSSPIAERLPFYQDYVDDEIECKA